MEEKERGGSSGATRSPDWDREQRLRVLHELAMQARPVERPQTSARPTIAAPKVPPRGISPEADRAALWRRAGRRRVFFTLGICVLLLAIVAGAVLRLQGFNPFARTSTNPPAGPLAISPASSALGCPSEAAWSPQGSSVALVGWDVCGSHGTVPGGNVLDVFDATTGKLRSQTKLDDAVSAAVTHAAGAPGVLQYAVFQQLLWSPAGRLAATFVGAGTSIQAQIYEGLVLVDENGQNLQVLVLRMPSDSYHYYVIWDLNSDKGNVIPDAIAGDQYSFATLYPGLTYTWGFGGSLFPSLQLPVPGAPNAGTTAAIGSPVSATFSLFQHGDLTLSSGVSGNLPTWFTSFAAWSPDGAQLVDSVTLTGLLQPIGQVPPDLSALGSSPLVNAPVIPVRDAGMQAVLAAMQASSTTRASQLAWRPDGKVLAAVAEQGPGGVPSTHVVTLFDCATGKMLSALQPPPSRGAGQPSGTLFLRWSPDGKHLLLYDPVLHVLGVWGPGSLPK